MKKFMSIVKDLNLKDVKPHTIVSLLGLIIGIINQPLLLAGKPIIDIGTDQLNAIVNTVYLAIFAFYSWYKNNSVTEPAQYLDKLLYKMRDGKLTFDEFTEVTKEFSDPDLVVKVRDDLFNEELDSAAKGIESENEEG